MFVFLYAVMNQSGMVLDTRKLIKFGCHRWGLVLPCFGVPNGYEEAMRFTGSEEYDGDMGNTRAWVLKISAGDVW